MIFVRKNKTLLLLLSLLLVGFGALIAWNNWRIGQIDSFEECQKAGYPIRESYPAQCSTPDGRLFIQPVEGQTIEVSGEYVCLPHKNTDGPQTLECAFGIKDESGDYYGLSDPDYKFLSSTATGTRVTVIGKLKSSPDTIYDILGIIEVESLTSD